MVETMVKSPVDTRGFFLTNSVNSTDGLKLLRWVQQRLHLENRKFNWVGCEVTIISIMPPHQQNVRCFNEVETVGTSADRHQKNLQKRN